MRNCTAIFKVVISGIHDDIQAATGHHQLCAGQLSGYETIMHVLWKTLDFESVILADASKLMQQPLKWIFKQHYTIFTIAMKSIIWSISVIFDDLPCRQVVYK